MSWLAELVESSEGSLEVLPVQCLCEFLLHDEDTPVLEEDSKLMGKHKQKQVCMLRYPKTWKMIFESVVFYLIWI